MNRKAFVVSGIVIVLILAAYFVVYEKDSSAAVKEPAKKLPVVAVASVETGSISRTIDLDGTVEATRIARLSSPAEGPVIACTTCNLREGDRVSQGIQIFRIGRDRAVNALMASARADLTREESELNRVRVLVENGAIPADQLDVARSRFQNARAQAARIEESRDDYRIVAPWSGIISRVMVVEGDYVAPRAPLIEIFDPASLVVSFSVPEAESQRVSPGKAVSVRLDAYPGKTFSARVSRVYPNLDLGTRTRVVEAKLDERVELMPGLFARIRMAVEKREDALLVPVEAIVVNPKGERLAYVVRDGRAEGRKVATGLETGRIAEIVEGLKPGDQVVVAGNEKLKDGAEVRVMEKKVKQAESGTGGSAL